MIYRLVIRETIEHVHHIEASSEEEAREKWEHICVADYDEPGDAIERHIESLEELVRRETIA